MLNNLKQLVVITGVASVVGIFYAGGFANDQVKKECDPLPLGASQVCALMKAPKVADTIFWSGLVGGGSAGAIFWLLLQGGRINSKTVTWATVAILAVLVVRGFSIEQKAQAKSLSNSSNLASGAERKAFLDTLALAEGTFTDGKVGYDYMFGHKKFSDFSKHPGIVQGFTQTNGIQNTTDAAGAYQFLSTTFNGLQTSYPDKVPDFSPQSQDNAAILLIQKRGALDSVDSGQVEQALFKVCKEWASIPCGANNIGAYPQKVKTIEALKTFYLKRLEERR